MSIKKTILISLAVIFILIFLYTAWYVYSIVAQSIIEREIREAGLNPADYDLRGVAPWNVRKFITDKEIEKAGLNPENYNIKGELTADEARLEVIRQEISRQLAQYDLTINDIDLTGVDLIKLTPEEINKLVYQKVREKISQ